ncbi:MAG TPA: AsnC family transcriptional regulator [Actinobacteria bacterium]|nr:AsnC family transcriptional regulator [Actinomycetota bacterium]HCK78708.1 AsnC family transcriptional regulator [Actinomycetota bacterium]
MTRIPWLSTYLGADPLALAPRGRQDGRVSISTATAKGDRTEPLDAVGRSIVEHLQRDGRMSYAALAKEVGLSEAAVRQRVAKLTTSGALQIVAVTDPLQMGFSRAAMIGVGTEGDMESVAHALSALPEVSYVVVTAGSFDILVEVVCEDDTALLELLNERIRAIPGVRSTETFVYLKLHKQSYTWGTR